jgi:hypothetical protein
MLMLIATYITSPMHGQQRGILLRIHIFVWFLLPLIIFEPKNLNYRFW